MDEDQELPASGAWVPDVVIGDAEHRINPMSECSWSLRLGPAFSQLFVLLVR